MPPTAKAEEDLREAVRWFRHAAIYSERNIGSPTEYALVSGMQRVATGLSHMAVGLRATYLLLEDVQQQLKQNARAMERLSGR